MHKYLQMIVTSCVTLLLFFSIIQFGQVHFTGMDSGVLTNASYQYYLGYIPYVDVITGTPPSYFIGGKLAFLLFGVRFQSFHILTALFGVASLLYIAILSSKMMLSWKKILLYGSASIVITLLTYQSWNYDRITIVSAIIFLWTCWYVILFSNKRHALFLLAIQLIWISMVKANIAGILILGSFLIFIQQRKKVSVLSLYILSGITSVLILFLLHINILDLIHNYQLAGGRVFSLYAWNVFLFQGWEVQQTILVYLPTLFSGLILFGFIVWAYIFKHIRSVQYQLVQLGGLGIVAGIIGLGTNNDLNFVDALLIFYGIVFIFHAYHFSHVSLKISRAIEAGFLFTCFLLIVYGIFIGFTRANIAEGNRSYFYRFSYYPTAKCYGLPQSVCNTILDLTLPLIHLPKEDPTTLKTVTKLPYPFFSGMYVSPLLADIQEEITTVISLLKQQQITVDDLCFGPRIDYSYAVYGAKPPKKLPLWWESFNDPELKSQTTQMIENFDKNQRKVCLFIQQEYVFYPEELTSYLWSHYTGVAYRHIDVLFRQDSDVAQQAKKALVADLQLN